ncbi:MAG: VCBS repeat-containing protein [Planctomycetota bacterium]
MRRLGILLAVVLIASAAPAADAPTTSDATLTPGMGLAASRVVDVTGDGADDVLLVGTRGEVRVWKRDGKKAAMAAAAVGDFSLPEPKRTLLAVGDVLGTGGAPQLVVLSPKKVTAYRIGEDGVIDPAGTTLFRLPRRGPFALRIGAPRFSKIVSDLNGDGCLDVLVPGPKAIRVWLCRDGENGREFHHAASVRTDLKTSRSWSEHELSDMYESAFRIPYLDLKDVNGDDRPDLIVIDGSDHAFHLQREDGSFPEVPDRVLDLSIFQDTSPASSIRPGRALAGGSRPSLTMTDLDADGIPDYVISHRRRVWTFHGSADGPKFDRPTQILATAEDVSAFLVIPLDGDAHPDLLLLRIQVPSVTAIVGGLFTELSVEISATGYANRTGRAFSKLPDWRGAIEVRLPAITEMIRNPQALIERFEAATSKFRTTLEADFDGDGTKDVAMLSEDATRIDLWHIESRPGTEADLVGLRQLFFEDEKRVWTLEDVLSLLGGIAEERTRRLTGGRKPGTSIALRPGRYLLRSFDAGNLLGGGHHAIVVFYGDIEHAGEAVVDVFCYSGSDPD